MYYPRIPQYNVCNRQYDWNSIFRSIAFREPKIDYDILISASNENRFNFILEESNAILGRVNESLQSIDRMRRRFDEAVANLGELELLLIIFKIAEKN